MPYDFSLSSEVLNGRTIHYAQLNGSAQPRFMIGKRAKYQQYIGLSNTQLIPGLIYKPEAYTAEYGFWAYFVHPTAQGESKGSFICLNTYDTAKFTFSFMQYGAHVPNGDFVKLFKKLLALPLAREYFPKLILKDSRIFYEIGNGVLQQLENDQSTQGLMDYFNPDLKDVEQEELFRSARMLHWATYDPEHIKIQVKTAVENYKENLKAYGKRYGLHNAPAKVCLMVCDIRHQGRAGSDMIIKALDTNGNFEQAFDNLCKLGASNFAERITTVRGTINNLLAEGVFNKKYDSAANSFVDF